MSWAQHSYAPIGGQTDPYQWHDARSIRAPSYSSQHDSLELQQAYRVESSRSHLLSPSADGPTQHEGSGQPFGPSLREFAKLAPGLWKNQMLVDRSLRGMALLTSCFALSMLIVVAIWLPAFAKNQNSQSTAVFAKEESCKNANVKNTAIHLIINIIGTMILGMSNTYQTLVTALDVKDIPVVLKKYGDCKVGTNSPFSISRKVSGRGAAWLAWILLIATSLPIHLLANSFVGLSLAYPETKVHYVPGKLQPSNTTLDNPSFACWAAFRTGVVWWSRASPPSLNLSPGQSIPDFLLEDSYLTSRKVWTITYDEEKCSDLTNSTPSIGQLEQEYTDQNATCLNSRNVDCDSGDPDVLTCRISIRMQAALTLAGALLIKAVYMMVWNIRMRGQLKTRCLSFGDVIAASALNPTLQVQNECMVNAGDSYRKRVEHSCHKHCKGVEPSSTGDELGHCQKCKKFNTINRMAALEHPIVATKYKKSLISNLGSNAVVQMILLFAGSVAMLGVSIYVAVSAGMNQQEFERACRSGATTIRTGQSPYFNQTDYKICMDDSWSNWRNVSGEWGERDGGVALGDLPTNRITSEFASFMIANGAQLIYSLLYLLVIYNITLISMERDWGAFERTRNRIRCTIFKGQSFYQSYLLQLPKRVIFPIMAFSALMHWLLGQAISVKELAYFIPQYQPAGITAPLHVSQYTVVYAAYPVWLSTILMILMTSICWWAFTYSREGYMPQMYGSMRVCCAATSSIKELTPEGIQWGDLGMGKRFRCAGFSEGPVSRAVPGELYCSNSPDLDQKHVSATSSLRQRVSSDTMASKIASQHFERSSSYEPATDYQFYRSGYRGST